MCLFWVVDTWLSYFPNSLFNLKYFIITMKKYNN